MHTLEGKHPEPWLNILDVVIRLQHHLDLEHTLFYVTIKIICMSAQWSFLCCDKWICW